MTSTSLKDLRSFGLLMAGVGALIGLWPLIVHQEPVHMWVLGFSGVFLGLGLLFPKGLQPIYTTWMKVGGALGWVNTRIILSLGFFGIFTPIGMVMRMTGRDPMLRSFDPEIHTYRMARVHRPGSHMSKQF